MCERWPALLLLATLAAWPAAAGERFDPTRPPLRLGATPELAPQPGRRLTSIRVSPRSRVATIDGRPVQVGDRVGEASVVAIEPTAVRLRDGEGEFEMLLRRTEIRKRRVHEEEE